MLLFWSCVHPHLTSMEGPSCSASRSETHRAARLCAGVSVTRLLPSPWSAAGSDSSRLRHQPGPLVTQKAGGAERGAATSTTRHRNVAVPTAQGAEQKLLLSPHSSALALIAASDSLSYLPPPAWAIPSPPSPICPTMACSAPAYRFSESALLTLKLVAQTHQMPSPQKGRNSSISTFVFIPIQGEKLKLQTLCRTEVHKFKKKKEKRTLFVNTSALCVIWNGIFLPYWNQSWFILVWWPDPTNFVLSQYSIELTLFPQCCTAADPAVWQPDNPGLASGSGSWLEGSSHSTHRGIPWHRTVSRRAVGSYGKAKALGVQQKRTGTSANSSLSTKDCPEPKTMFWSNSEWSLSDQLKKSKTKRYSHSDNVDGLM